MNKHINTWVMIGATYTFCLGDLVSIGIVDEESLRLVFRNSEVTIVACPSGDAAIGHYQFVQSQLGFSVPESPGPGD